MLQKVYIGFNKRKDSSFELFFFRQLNDMKISILPLNKMIIDAFDIDKMLYGIFSFSCGNIFGFFV